MGELKGFLKYGRKTASRRPVNLRVKDFKEFYEPFSDSEASLQGARCMDCGIPFCHIGCPLGNLIPEWNDLVYKWNYEEAMERLHATNNFPEATSRLCPAPCETACVLGINDDPVSIKQLEAKISEKAFERGLVPVISQVKTGKKVAVVGSGPAGLSCAQQLVRAGHDVVVYERAELPGGLLRYGIPEFKMEKHVLDTRIAQLEQEGIQFVTKCSIGESQLSYSHPSDATIVDPKDIISRYDATVFAIGSTVPRPINAKNSNLKGIHYAMEFLRQANLFIERGIEPEITARDKNVLIIGGGDTGADCLGTVHRQGAKSVKQLEILPVPPSERTPDNPWPTWPNIFRTSSAHEEGGERLFSVETIGFLGSDYVTGIEIVEVEPEIIAGQLRFSRKKGTEKVLETDLVLLAMGFVGPEPNLIEHLGLELTPRSTIKVDDKFSTNFPGVFACGDCQRGQSLIVWAIAEGRSCARSVDEFLCGSSFLPSPVTPNMLALR